MNTLTYLASAALASAGIAFWQQGSLRQTQEETHRLTQECATWKTLLEVKETQLGEARSQMASMRADLSLAKADAGRSAVAALPTPESEGWWPKDRPYFYLPKARLKLVSFGTSQLPTAEVNAILTRRAKARSPYINEVRITSPGSIDGTQSVEMGLFEGQRLSPDAAALLGMTEDEVGAVSGIYTKLFGDVRALEQSNVVRVNDGGAVLARLPALSSESATLLDEVKASLTAAVGPARSELLERMFRDYANEHLDGMGSKPRDFIRKGDVIIVRTDGSERWQPLDLKGAAAWEYNVTDYAHLFGPGGPCELK